VVTDLTLNGSLSDWVDIYCSCTKIRGGGGGGGIIIIIEVKNVKVNLSLCLTKHHAMKTYWGSECIAQLILDLGTRWR
jgi:mevalonate kinase